MARATVFIVGIDVAPLRESVFGGLCTGVITVCCVTGVDTADGATEAGTALLRLGRLMVRETGTLAAVIGPAACWTAAGLRCEIATVLEPK